MFMVHVILGNIITILCLLSFQNPIQLLLKFYLYKYNYVSITIIITPGIIKSNFNWKFICISKDNIPISHNNTFQLLVCSQKQFHCCFINPMYWQNGSGHSQRILSSIHFGRLIQICFPRYRNALGYIIC